MDCNHCRMSIHCMTLQCNQCYGCKSNRAITALHLSALNVKVQRVICMMQCANFLRRMRKNTCHTERAIVHAMELSNIVVLTKFATFTSSLLWLGLASVC